MRRVRAQVRLAMALPPVKLCSGLGEIQGKQTATHFDTHLKNIYPTFFPLEVIAFWPFLAMGSV